MAADLPSKLPLFPRSEHAHITENNGYYLVSLLPPIVPKVSHYMKLIKIHLLKKIKFE